MVVVWTQHCVVFTRGGNVKCAVYVVCVCYFAHNWSLCTFTFMYSTHLTWCNPSWYVVRLVVVALKVVTTCFAYTAACLYVCGWLVGSFVSNYRPILQGVCSVCCSFCTRHMAHIPHQSGFFVMLAVLASQISYIVFENMDCLLF